MPLHTFYSVPGTFSAKDKAAIAEGITNTYSILPKFYVVVQFIDVAEGLSNFSFQYGEF